MDIRVLNYSGGPMTADSALWNNIEDKKELRVTIIPRLRYSEGSEICGFQFDFIVVYDNQRVIKTGFLFGLGIENLVEYIGNKVSEEKKRKSIEDILKKIWPYAGGAFAARCSDKGISLLLPEPDLHQLSADTLLQSK